MNSFLIDLLSITAVISAILVITSKSPVVSVLFLIGAFISSACYLLVLGVGFVGISYLIVYVGAIAVLFLFVVMMLNIRIGEIISVGQEYTQGIPLGFIVGSISLLELLSVLPTLSSQAGQISLNIFNTINSSLLGINSSYSYEGVNLAFSPAIPDVVLTEINHVQSLGLNLYGYGSLWLFLTSLILLLAMLGPLLLCLRSRTSNAS